MPVVEVADRFGVSRQAIHRWVVRYRTGGLEALADRSKRPKSSPWQVPAQVEALVCQLRREHPRWGPRRLRAELAKRQVAPLPHRSSIYRILLRFELVTGRTRRRRREDYKRWQRERPMQLWQMDLTASCFLVDGTECKIVTGVDGHSRYCVIATVVPRGSGRAVCLAFVRALPAFGCPDEVLTVKSVSVVEGDQRTLAGRSGGPVVPDAGGQREQAGGDAGEHALVGAGAVAFQVELALEGLVDRLDPLPHPAEVAVGVGLVAAVWAQQPQSHGVGDLFELAPGEALVGEQDLPAAQQVIVVGEPGSTVAIRC